MKPDEVLEAIDAARRAGVLTGINIAVDVINGAFKSQNEHAPGTRPALSFILDSMAVVAYRIADGAPLESLDMTVDREAEGE